MKKLIYSSLFAMLLLCLCVKNGIAQDDQTVYNFVSMETPPSYPGGIANFYKFLGENIKYPKAAKDENVQGSVFVSFTVEKDGTIEDVKVDRKLGAGTDEEAVRVLKLSKRWNAGLINGKPVRVKYNLPIKFHIPGKKPSNPKMATVAPATVSPTDTTVFSFISVKNPPKYKKGMPDFYSFLAENIKYPKEARDNKIEGTVFLSFVVEKDGSLNDIKVDRKLGHGTDEEAIRVIKLSEKWIPGTVNEIPVRIKYNIPVKFSLKNDSKMKID